MKRGRGAVVEATADRRAFRPDALPAAPDRRRVSPEVSSGARAHTLARNGQSLRP